MTSQPEGKVLEGVTCSSDLNFLDLPHLVLDEVLERLDKISLKNLRSVCQKSKSLVETPKYLERLMIHISGSAHVQEIMNSTVQWNSFNISLTYMDEIATLSFLQIVRPRLSKLKIHGHYIDPKQLTTIMKNVGPTLRIFVSECQNLISASYAGLDLRVQLQDMRNFLEKSHSSLQQNLVGLQHVIFRGMECRSGLNFASMFLNKFLECSPGLITLKFPLIPIGYHHQNIGLNGSDEINCSPLLSYLMRNKYMSKIDFGFLHHRLRYGSRETGDWSEQTHRSPFHLTKSSLLDLVKLCEPIGVKLYNVPSSALPNRHHVNSRDEQCFKKCVASILCANVVQGIPDTIYVPPGCPIKLIIFPEPEYNFSQFELSVSLNVVSIHFVCNFMNRNHSVEENLMKSLFRVVRNSVLELKLCNTNIVIQFMSPRYSLGSVFPNLKKLWLQNDERVGAVRFGDWLNDLHQLEEIRMDCIDYEQYFQVGECLGHQLAKLKRLKRIEMNNCNAVMKFSTG